DSDAMDALRSRLRVVVPAAALLANEELVIALPNQGQAVRTLSLLLTEMSPPGPNVTVFFKEKVRVEVRDVPPDRLVGSPEEAVSRVVAEASPRTEHEVERGESAWKIARDYNVTLQRLGHANPELDLEALRAGAKLKIPGRLPPITVVARKEIEEEIGEGARRRTRKVRITYENGMEVKRQVIGGQRPGVSVPSAGPYREPWRWRDEITQ
ncbi:MAG: LysM peptidoglycan-binding domain-containing protein, partial [Armatimonadota bacterium]|nr:LysM peptidoglycan-binding domain-containing protein [Armatimonadota bacterium]